MACSVCSCSGEERVIESGRLKAFLGAEGESGVVLVCFVQVEWGSPGRVQLG